MLPSSDPVTQKPCLPIDKFIIGPTTLGGYRRSITIRYFVVIICLRFDYRKSQNRKQGREISDRWDLSRTPSRGRPRRLLSTPTSFVNSDGHKYSEQGSETTFPSRRYIRNLEGIQKVVFYSQYRQSVCVNKLFQQMFSSVSETTIASYHLKLVTPT